MVHGAIDDDHLFKVCQQQQIINCPNSVLSKFYEIPSWVRGDRGCENTLVANFMIAQCGTGRGSFICGQSVHNQWIEQLWRDVFNACIALYYGLFHYLEEINVLDPECDVHLFYMHYVYLSIEV